MLRVAFHNLGCKVNAYETERMIQSFSDAGYEIADFEEKADIYVINTCTVTNIADRKSRQMLSRARAMNPEALVVACGCYVETRTGQGSRKGAPGSKGTEQPENPDKAGAGADSDGTADILILNNEKKDIVEIVEQYIRKGTSVSRETNSDNKYYGCQTEERAGEDGQLRALHDHTRAYVKIQDGCDQFCSYCIIPMARGRVRSRRPGEIIKELEALAANGIKEAVLTGIHLSSYGIDFSQNENGNVNGRVSYNQRAMTGEYVNRELIEVIRRAAEIEGIERIRLGSLEPRIITEEFLSAVKENPKVCPHFHLSLQSGSDTVLKRMNRHYDTEEYEKRVEMIRSCFSHPAVTTDIIVGFPGESEAEFLETRDYLNRIGFYETHIFKYSRRKGTRAERMEGQLTEKEKAVRAGILAEDDRERRERFRSYYFNREEEVLFEEEKQIDGERYYIGFNREYVKMAAKSEEDLTNRIIRGTTGEKVLWEQLLVFYPRLVYNKL